MKYTEKDITPEIHDQIKAKLRHCIKLAQAAFNRKFYMPTLEFSLSNTTAGVACGHSNTIKLNPTLLIENLDDFINQTIPHEFAHLVADVVYPSGHCEPGKKTKRVPHHGSGWKRVMEIFNIPALKYHDYKVEQPVKQSRLKYAHTCSQCGNTFSLTVQQAASVRSRPASLFHNKCGKDSRFIPVEKDIIPLTKFEKCEQLYLAFRDADRADVIQLFIKHVHTTPAGSVTYYAKLRKKYDR